ncbi:MAG: nucleotidyltransferase domain-containing protein [Clostridia bacterium]|nr:nucleotidyltransferase domain-containing protein [Clostridia bacterium]
MNTVNRKIINAIIEKAESLYPDSVALIGAYGSVTTGDDYAKSDLDLLILIQDEEGRKLGTGFILNDSGVGYDIYCTDWNNLHHEAQCHHAHISKLMVSEVIYVKNQKAYAELCKLREETKLFLESDERFQRVNELITKAKVAYADALLCNTLGQVRLKAFGVMDCLLNAVMLYHGKYFRLGVKRTFDEIANLPVSDEFSDNMRKTAASKDASEIRDLLKSLILYVEKYVHQEKPKADPSAVLTGTYEELYSNWRNKVEQAANKNDVFSSFVNMCCFNYMLSDISAEFNIGDYNIMDEYNPERLTDNVLIYDKYLEEYEKVCNKVGIKIKRFSDVDAFVADYLENQ